jgi:5-dehydro-2-deoxygluconokinase
MAASLDLITIGRAGVDLYGAQIGGRLEDMASFEKYIGGSPTNIAAGTARLGLKSALISRVGDEHMGRFIREQLEREGVDTTSVITDPERLTALVLLGIRDREQFPLIFVRENCADMALCEDDIDPDFINQSRCLVATGTHLSHPVTEAAVMKALNIGWEKGLKLALDIDYRPNLWGLAGHDAGESRFIASEAVTEKLQKSLPLFDLIVGTEEEFHIAGGSTDTIEALRAVRAISKATLVCKRGPMGAAAFDGEIPDSLDNGVHGPGFPIEVFNVLGAGDGFMSGLLKGWLDGEPMEKALEYANACGALAVSRHGCTPAYPSWTELQYFLGRGIVNPALRHDQDLEQVHWSTNRRQTWPDLRIFAFDHRMQFEQMADDAGADRSRIGEFKSLCLQAINEVAAGQPGYGLLCDHRLGSDSLYAAAGQGLWIGRPVEWPGSRPLQLEPELGEDFGGLREWPLEQIVKVLCFYHPDDDAEMRLQQEQTVSRLFQACRRNRLEFLLEIVASKAGPVDDSTTAAVIQRFYDIGVYPDWWKLEPLKTARAWRKTCDTIERNDPHVQGIVILGLDAPVDELGASFKLATAEPLVKGFAIGRTIFSDAARAWFAGRIDDQTAVKQMSEKYLELCGIWDRSRNDAGVAA